ncbi:MAG: hypothetical protein GDA38_23935 [Hormoscilla sp. SP12CHS1]|nr:hypothetical protein [Hormoscilla sp. SP12CHS1]
MKVEKPGFFDYLDGKTKILTETRFLVFQRRSAIAHHQANWRSPLNYDSLRVFRTLTGGIRLEGRVPC